MSTYCQLCDAHATIKMKCYNCDLNMCKKYQENIHSKIHGSGKHYIVKVNSLPGERHRKNSRFLLLGCCMRNLKSDVQVITPGYQPFQNMASHIRMDDSKKSYSFREEEMSRCRTYDWKYQNELPNSTDRKYQSELPNSTDRKYQRELPNSTDRKYQIELPNSTDRKHQSELPNSIGSTSDTEQNIVLNHKTKLYKQLQVMKCFSTNVPVVSRLIYCPDHTLWITRASTKTLQTLKIRENCLTMVGMFNIKVYDIARTQNGDILIASTDSVLRVIPRGKTHVEFSKYDVSPFLPTAVHVSRHGKVTIGAMSIGTAFPVTGERKLIIMDMGGIWEDIIEYDEQNSAFLNYP